MCGIFGIFIDKASSFSAKDLQSLSEELFVLSEARGKESSGIAIKNYVSKEIHVSKNSISASQFIQSEEYAHLIRNAISEVYKDGLKTTDALAIMAHARLVTNGSQENNNNNQPTIKSGKVAIHNGIITNVDHLWKKHAGLQREFEVDTEILLSLLTEYEGSNTNADEVFRNIFQETEGTITSCIMSDNNDDIYLVTNNASLYYSYSIENGIFVFASEAHILNTAISKLNFDVKYRLKKAEWSKPNTGFCIGFAPLSVSGFNLKQAKGDMPFRNSSGKYQIINHSVDQKIILSNAVSSAYAGKKTSLEKIIQVNQDAIRKLKRCSKCLLPSTFPFISYDAAGECNYCKRYTVRKQGSRETEFKELMKSYRSKDGSPDCIIPFSGGRDSSYGLHYIVHELGLHPITYTYDWGMVTDLARRNIARVCGKLGIENIIVSADIAKKRNNIRKNVEAWLKNPQLGMIPLFMAGDKQFFYYVNQIKRQTGIKLDIWSTNILENTDFKVGFCGVSPSFDKHRPDFLPLKSKVMMALYYLKNFMMNPAYLNASITDTLASFYSYYAEPRTHFYQLFDYIRWDEKQIEKTLFEEYNWEMSPDTSTSWRIGDGTAAFYNYIYYTVAGFSEFDTFRSNQIRENLITREQGLELIYKENLPRIDSLIWYFETIQSDVEKAIEIVNKIPKLYEL